MRQADRIAFDDALRLSGVPEVDRPRLLMMVQQIYLTGRDDLRKDLEKPGQKVVVQDHHAGFAEQAN